MTLTIIPLSSFHFKTFLEIHITILWSVCHFKLGLSLCREDGFYFVITMANVAEVDCYSETISMLVNITRCCISLSCFVSSFQATRWDASNTVMILSAADILLCIHPFYPSNHLHIIHSTVTWRTRFFPALIYVTFPRLFERITKFDLRGCMEASLKASANEWHATQPSVILVGLLLILTCEITNTCETCYPFQFAKGFRDFTGIISQHRCNLTIKSVFLNDRINLLVSK